MCLCVQTHTHRHTKRERRRERRRKRKSIYTGLHFPEFSFLHCSGSSWATQDILHGSLATVTVHIQKVTSGATGSDTCLHCASLLCWFTSFAGQQNLELLEFPLEPAWVSLSPEPSTWLASWGTRHLSGRPPAPSSRRQGERQVSSSSAWVSVCPWSLFASNYPSHGLTLLTSEHTAQDTDYSTSSPHPLLCQIKPLKGRRGTVALDFEPVALGRNMDRRIGIFNNRSHGLAI